MRIGSAGLLIAVGLVILWLASKGALDCLNTVAGCVAEKLQ
jgi:hypothetical protein